MSFQDYSTYIFGFEALDMKIPNKSNQNKYYNKWMKKYAEIFKSSNNFSAIEWELRCQKSLREIFSSATFYVEAKKNLETKCFSSYYFCLYYSLFHAVYACIFLDTHSDMKKLLSITHRNIINIFISAFGNSADDIMTRKTEDLFKDLKYKREYYSYVTPFNNIFNHKEGLELLESTLIECYQLSSFHTLMIQKSYDKKIGKIVKFENAQEVYQFNELFEILFSKKDDIGKNKLDSASENLRYELNKYGFKPTYIAVGLEHQFDEFHTYDRFYDEYNDYDLKITDIWSFVAEAIILDYSENYRNKL